MNRKDIEKRIKEAVNNEAPDIKEQVVEKCRQSEAAGDGVVPFIPKRMRFKMHALEIVTAVAVCLMLTNVFSITMKNSKENKVETVIDIDVNPSVELKINAEDRVISVVAINEDAEGILDGMDLKGAQTKVAVNAIFGSMMSKGYFENDKRTILVSVDSKSKTVTSRVQNDVTAEIDNVLTSYAVEADVIVQEMNKSDELAQTADELGISQGKAAFIGKIQDVDASQSEDELARMSITELDILCQEIDAGNVLEECSTENIRIEADTESDEANDSGNSDEKVTVSENSVSENSVSENSVSENDAEYAVSENSVSENSISDEDIMINE